ncbi:MAG: hypothetical protein IPK17_30315 [Chloroflexi bacterium]|uniref:hypothetical protein n=1 Tax=Candidatus Flexifilum breve TaxID=3140694 RepID=UPI0031349932|nr:hypothetical protein [Chloroflexota bacterium]
MGDALLQAAPAPCFNQPETPIYVVQVHDVVDDQPHADMLKAYAADPTGTYIAGYEREDYFPGGYLIVSPSGCITGIVEKPGAENRPSNLVNIVAHIHRIARACSTRFKRSTPSPLPAMITMNGRWIG